MALTGRRGLTFSREASFIGFFSRYFIFDTLGAGLVSLEVMWLPGDNSGPRFPRQVICLFFQSHVLTCVLDALGLRNLVFRELPSSVLPPQHARRDYPFFFPHSDLVGRYQGSPVML